MSLSRKENTFLLCHPVNQHSTLQNGHDRYPCTNYKCYQETLLMDYISFFLNLKEKQKNVIYTFFGKDIHETAVTIN